MAEETRRLTALLERLREKCAEVADDRQDAYAASIARSIRAIELDVAVRQFVQESQRDAGPATPSPAQHCNECETQTTCTDFPAQRECGVEGSAAGWVEAGLICQACAGDAPDGKCRNERCVGGPIVRELVPADGVPGTSNDQQEKDHG